MTIATGIIFLILSLLTTATNTLLIASLIATKQCTINTTNFLITCLSTSFLLIGIILMPIYSIQYIWHDLETDNLTMASAVLTAGFSGINLSLILLIAVDRYLHMDPDFHQNSTRLKKCFERPQIYVVVTISIGISSLLACAQFLLNAKGIYNLVYTILTIITLCTSVAVYIRGYNRIRHHIAGNPVYADRTEEPEYIKQLYKTVLILLVTLMISLLPISIAICITAANQIISGSEGQTNELYIFGTLSYYLYHSYSVANPLIVCYRNTKCRKWIVDRMPSCHC